MHVRPFPAARRWHSALIELRRNGVVTGHARPLRRQLWFTTWRLPSCHWQDCLRLLPISPDTTSNIIFPHMAGGFSPIMFLSTGMETIRRTASCTGASGIGTSLEMSTKADFCSTFGPVVPPSLAFPNTGTGLRSAPAKMSAAPACRSPLRSGLAWSPLTLKGPVPPRQMHDLLFVVMELTRERFVVCATRGRATRDKGRSEPQVA